MICNGNIFDGNDKQVRIIDIEYENFDIEYENFDDKSKIKVFGCNRENKYMKKYLKYKQKYLQLKYNKSI